MNSPSPDHLALCVRHTLEMPACAALNLRLVEQTEGRAVCRLDVTEAGSVGSGHLNGGELYGALDCVAYLALTTLVPDDEAAVTADAHFSILSAAPRGSEVEIRAKVEKRGKNLAFMRVEAVILGEGEPKMAALATVTKSIISMKARMRHTKP